MPPIMVQPEELAKDEPLLWSAGTGTEVWELFCASAAGDLATVERLVAANPSLVRAHHEYRTALYFAVRENQITVARFLLEHGANPFYNGEDLIEMSRLRRLADMEALIESHRALTSLVSHPTRNELATALADAAGRGQLDLVQQLLSRGADPNAPDEGNAPHGRALYAAVYNKHVAVAKFLLEHGANPNQEVESSADAPSIAIMNSDTAMIELLASYGGVWRIPVRLAGS
jgi:ankyrin repeat protein